MISFLDLITQHIEMEDDLVAVFREALRTGRFIGGPMVDGFEDNFALFCGAKYCSGAGSGTDALRFALMSAGIRAGDTVVTVPNTFIATTEAISQAGAFFDFVDIDPRTYNMDPEKLREYLETTCGMDGATGMPFVRATGSPVTAVVPVHLYGQMADMDAILELAGRYNLVVIEDACQAHGAEYFSVKENRWIKAGSAGSAAAFSFYPGKNLGACGEAGAVTTNDSGIAVKIRMIRDHGQAKKYYHDIEGYNGRLDAIQAGILQIKLKRLAGWNEKRRGSALIYNELLENLDDVVLPYEPHWSKAIYHLYVIRTKNRDALQTFLAQRNIATGLHYPVPLHLQNAYQKKGHVKGDFPVAEQAASEIISLPMYPGIPEGQQAQTAEGIRDFLETAAGR